MVITKVNGIDVTKGDVTHGDLVKIMAEAEGAIEITVGSLEHIPGAVTVSIPRHPNGLGLGVSSVGNQNDGIVISSVVAGGNASRTNTSVGQRVIMANGEVLLNASHGAAITACAAGDKEYARITLLPTHRKLPVLPAGQENADSVRTVTLPRDTSSNLGLVIATGRDGYGAFVQSILSGSTADKCGRIYPGDRIITLDGQKCAGLDHDEIVTLLQSHSTIVMTLTHDSTIAADLMANRGGTSKSIELPPMTPRMTREVVSGVVQLEGRGIGASISTEEKEMGVRISDIDPSGAVAADGIFEVGDHITQVDNIDVSAADHDFVAELLRDKGMSGFNFYMVASRQVFIHP
jgi:C-terminal processing protease CtpA/Prc